MKNAFITGSRAYGIPNNDSDLDLVLLIDRKAMLLIQSLSDLGKFHPASGNEEGADINPDAHYDDDVIVCRYGNLNLIMFCEVDKFDAWEKGTDYLINKKPCTRNFAKATIQFMLAQVQRLREANNIDSHVSKKMNGGK